MNIIEASNECKKSQKEISNLHDQLLQSICRGTHEDDEVNPMEIYRQISMCFNRLKKLYYSIGSTIAHSKAKDKELSGLIIEQKVMSYRLRLMREIVSQLQKAREKGVVVDMDSALIMRQTETLEELKAELDSEIQSALHEMELDG